MKIHSILQDIRVFIYTNCFLAYFPLQILEKSTHVHKHINSIHSVHPKWMSHPPCLTLQRLYTPKTSHIALNYIFFKKFSKKSKVFEKLTTTINIFTVTNNKKKTLRLRLGTSQNTTDKPQCWQSSYKDYK